MKKSYSLYLANEPIAPNLDLEVFDKFTGQVVTRVPLAESDVIEEAIAQASLAAKPMRQLPRYQRSEILNHCLRRFQERFEELAQVLCLEAGKPIRDARGEVTRLIDTFRIAAEEAVRFGGEFLPLDISPRAAGYEAIYKRVPVGPCACISPFNFPLNLVAHKVAPAIAAGCPFILKPASWTPIGALIIGEILAETDLPKGAFSILPIKGRKAEPLVTDDRLKLLTFTGSPEVGWALKAKAGKKKVVLELGGNAGCIVEPGVDLEYVADRITFGAFYQSGQSCISVQRVYVHESIYDELKVLLLDRAGQIKAGNPLAEETSLGPLISEADAIRIESWVQEAVDHGAQVLCGGRRQGVFYDATWLENVDPQDKVSCQEVFGPVAILNKYSDYSQAVASVNDSKYGLQAGIFTKNIDQAFYAWNEIEVGGVIINDIPSFRVDNMPYGGVKESGIGREGIRWAMEDMTEIRLMVLNQNNKI